MLLSFLVSVSFLALKVLGGKPDCECLTDAEAEKIVANWVSLYFTVDPSTPAWATLLADTMAEDLTVEDLTVNFFFFPTNPTGPYITNSTQFAEDTEAQWQGLTVSPSSIKVVKEIPLIHDCSAITFRWAYSATVNTIEPYR